MSDEIVYSERGPSDGRKSFADEFSAAARRHNDGWQAQAPEVRARQAQEPEASPELTTAWTVAAEQAARADAAEAAAEYEREAHLTDLAYSEPDAYAELVATELLEAGGGPRMESFISSWAESEPIAAQQFVENAQAAVASRALSAVQQQTIAEREEYARARAAAVEQFVKQHPEVGSGNLATELLTTVAPFLPGISQASPEQLTAKFEDAWRTAKETERATGQAHRVREIKAAFAQPSFADFKYDRQPKAEPVVDETSILRRMKPANLETPEQRQARREQGVADFRASFKDAARSRFGPNARAS